MILITFLAIVIAYATLEAYFNKLMLEKKDWHLTQWLIRGLVLIAILLYPNVEFNEAWRLVLIAMATWWIYFDIVLNLIRRPKLKWTHRGYNFLDMNGKLNKTDKGYRLYIPFSTWFTLKAVVFGISLFIYFDIYGL